MADCVGRQLGKYHLVRRRGEGGFGDVYLGEHVEDGTQAAIKVLHEPLTNENIKEFVNEAGLCQLLRHESIVRLLDVGIGDDHIPFLVMEYAPNGSLADCHPRGTRLPLDTIVSYVKPISAALQYAHGKGLIHRDVKPANFFFGTNGKVLLGDFGIAAIALSTRSREQQRERQKVVGSWAYAAPEQFVGKAVPASDQYSLAVVVYEWLCGERPFHGDFQQLAVQHYLNNPPPPLHEKMSISPAVEQVVMRALEKDPKNRFASVQDFAIALETAVPSTTPSQMPHVLAKTQASSLIGHFPVSRAVRQQRDKAELYMLQRVKRLWIAEVLDHSLHREAARVLAASHPAGAAGVGIFPRNLILEGPNGQRSPLSSDTPIIQVYDEAGGDLLIVGQSGVGKTTLLLELARALIKRAESDPTRPLPIVLSLESWATKQLSIEAWLIEEIHAWYPKSYGYAEQWIKLDQLHPLFDGLDEIPDEKRAACVNALAVYWRDHTGIPMVICSQKAQTLMRVENFPFKRLISVHPPSFREIDHYLDNVGMSLQSLREVLCAETALQAIASCPLMLCLLILTYHQSKSARDLQIVSPKNLPAYICSLYVRRTLHRTEVLGSSDPNPRSIQGLKWLACMMKQQNLSLFMWDQVKREWLQGKQQCTKYYDEVCQSMNGGTISLRRGRQEWLRDKQLHRLYRETRLWHIHEGVRGCLIICLSLSLLTGLLFEIPVGLRFGLVGVLRFGLFLGLIFGLLFGLVVLYSRLIHEPNIDRREILNWSLWQSGYSPVRDFRDFLDDAVERHLLHKVGNGYRFVHPLLLDYFASDTKS